MNIDVDGKNVVVTYVGEELQYAVLPWLRDDDGQPHVITFDPPERVHGEEAVAFLRTAIAGVANS